MQRLWLVLLTSVLLAGCASQSLQYSGLTSTLDGDARRIELEDTPFFSQTANHCGPAALATVLRASGVVEASPETLAPQVYLPARRGTLQAELLAATRRANRIPYVLEPKLADLLREVNAGNPVLVLQNLRLASWPKWHFAVVIGYDLDVGEIILRSGEERRQIVSMRRFERTWQKGDYWALVVAPPGATPVTATSSRFLQAVAPLEQQRRWQAAEQGYRAARQRWPDNPVVFMGLGNIAYQMASYDGAARHYQAAIERAPEMPAAHYNLAWALLRQNRTDAARLAAAQAERLAPEHSRYGHAVSDIEAAIQSLD